MLKRLFKFVGYLLALTAIVFIGLIVFGLATDYSPPEIEDAEMYAAVSPSGAVVDSTLRFAIWNIGYGGLGKEQDFFFDGGKYVRPPKDIYEKDMRGVIDFASAQQDLDFLLFQEVDRDSKRSYGNDQAKQLAEQLPGHHWNFALNYNVKFIPVPFDPIPFTRSMGRVKGGLTSFSKYKPSTAVRHDLPGSYPFYKRIYMLDRCFMEQRFAAPGGKELVVVNTHNSAYDNGDLKAQEMEMLRGFLESEYDKGNYVIVGGDWNQCPPNFDPKTFKKEEAAYDQINISRDYLPEWTWAYDPSSPTNRKVATTYDPLTTFTTVIDFFLISPNVHLQEVKNLQQGFDFSDHQPVFMTVKLK